ncbi:ABC transporter permease [Streptomyces sp. NPDC057474]|uniref:ABC transporter permease n=1 Tax=Streptomyces sp. NPDC057474 TaxID=3346144 RepID=UPI0036B66846
MSTHSEIRGGPAGSAGRPRRAERGRTAGRSLSVPAWAQTWSGVLGIMALAELTVRTGIVSREHFPPLSSIFTTLFRQFQDVTYWNAVAGTLQGWAVGLAIATVIAVPLGMAIGFSELAYRALRPIIEFLRPVPSVALIPLSILIYGTGLGGKVFLVAFAATWPIMIQALYGARDVDPVQLDTAKSYRIPPVRRALRVVLPSTVPYIATGLRIASATALILAVTAELIIGSTGLGRSISEARQGGAVELMYALITTTGLLGWGLNSLFALVERRALHWHPSHRQGQK